VSDSRLAHWISANIAYDWINEKIYVVDYEHQRILLAGVDGSDVITVLNVQYPGPVALHPCQG